MLPKPLVAASLRPLILSLLSVRAMYGYELIQRVHELSDGQIRWTASKLYPLLHDLENKEWVEPFWQPSDNGPDRKYYRLTAKGRAALVEEKQHWAALNGILGQLWAPAPALGE